VRGVLRPARPYGYALQRYGREAVLKHVGVEPTGEAFNSIVLDEVANPPFNPMVNAGAIAVAELMAGETQDERIATMVDLFSRLAGRQLGIDAAVFNSELATGHRNRAIAYMMLNTGMIKRDPNEVLDLYFRQCSIDVACRDLAIMAATLANDGRNPPHRRASIRHAICPRRAVGDEVLRHVRLCGRMGL
jgi:glutaminase